ncbi:general stress protein 26 [Anseongella ginsenosidimutans]|uniref:General stress protein 26 n=1 Tax=Anseongella ginsenosidimutans TaxID=496056 RepID=A0A4R3KKU8_9SPHI|nr:pyridoxamine 5'-phosphate oxidase family protein [Anseongella ginsenosidimutans]QEC53603.1 pyridoxamine 5'-phosphate oxidase family protein [Anseongella ginsenosidimutans]TCS83946.1 general stress protein 26 [Anseongella ginsenosidimutans]
MGTENLHNREATKKLKELVDKIDIGILCTFVPESVYPHAVPMSRQEVDEQGNIWYLFSTESETYTNLERNSKISVLFSHVGDYNFLSVNGIAEISRDGERVDKYWNKMMESWFEKGKDDPRIRILKVVPQEAHYWDNKSNKLITLLKMAANAVSGSKMSLGRDGELNL